MSVHRDVICSTSEVLKKAFAAPYNKLTTLRNIGQAHFTTYVNWLYTGIIRSGKGQALLVQLYHMGAMLQDRKFKNAIISVLLRLAREITGPGAKSLPDETCINIAYNAGNLVPSASLKQLQRCLVEIYANEEHTVSLMAIKDKVDRNFLSDLSLRLMEMRLAKHKNLFEVRDCAFYEHKPKEKFEVQEPAKKRRREE